jgi:hypothetical protein
MSTDSDYGVSLGDPFAGGDPTVAWAAENDARDPVDVEDQADPVDPEAPFGRNPRNGKPYKMSAEDRAALGAKLAQARADAAANRGETPKRRGRPASKSTGSTGSGRPSRVLPDYRMAVAGLLQLPAYALGVGARIVPSMGLDAIALSMHTPAIADAVGQLAEDDPRVAAILDRVMAVGPYGALFAAITPLIMQIMCNHGLLRPHPMMGTLSSDELMALVEPPESEGP